MSELFDADSPGVIKGETTTDYLYRISLKAVIYNDQGEILLVKESGRDWWDLPGGGLDYGETVHECLARELSEEVGLKGDFTYRVIALEEAKLLERLNVMQVNVIVEVTPHDPAFGGGVHGDELCYMSVGQILNSELPGSRLRGHVAVVEGKYR